jgi:hypothetical protein
MNHTRRGRIAATLVLVSTLGVGSMGGVASAVAAAPNEHVTFVITSHSGGSVFFSGVVNDAGTNVSGGDDNAVDANVLARGTIFVYHKSIGEPTFTLDVVTCLAHVDEVGIFTVTGGTGAYSAIGGSGTYTLRNGIFQFPRANGQCNFGADPLFELLVINGTLSLNVNHG